MKKIIFTFGFFFVLFLNINAQNDSIPHNTIEQQQKAIQVATEWISMFYEAENTDALMNISKLPFAINNEKISNSNKEIEAMYASIIEDKSQLKKPKLKAEIYKEEHKLIEGFSFVNFLLVFLTITEKKDERPESLLVFVEIDGENYKVIGFQD